VAYGAELLQLRLAERVNEPLIPFTVIMKVPLVDGVHDRMDVPDPAVIMVVLRIHDRPLLGDAIAVNVTVPVNPPTGEMVISEVREAPVALLRLVGLALMVKSWSV